MKKSKTALLVGASVLTIGGTGLGATASATNGYTQSSGDSRVDSSWNWYWNNERDEKFDAELSVAIAQKYSVDEAEATALVETVRDNQFNVLNDERQATLDEALKNETITQEQYDTIIGHFNKIDAAYDKIDDANWSERRDLWKEIKTEFIALKDYMSDEDISIDLALDMKYERHSHHDRTEKDSKQ